jgi:hypothetical protein
MAYPQIVCLLPELLCTASHTLYKTSGGFMLLF